MKDQCISGEDLLFEFDIVNFHEVGGVVLGVWDSIQGEDATDLSHGLHLQYARHHGISRKMTLEIRFIEGDIFQANDAVIIDFQNPINQ